MSVYWYRCFWLLFKNSPNHTQLFTLGFFHWNAIHTPYFFAHHKQWVFWIPWVLCMPAYLPFYPLTTSDRSCGFFAYTGACQSCRGHCVPALAYFFDLRILTKYLTTAWCVKWNSSLPEVSVQLKPCTAHALPTVRCNGLKIGHNTLLIIIWISLLCSYVDIEPDLCGTLHVHTVVVDLHS